MQTELNGPADEAVLRDAMRRIIERNLAFCLVVSDGISERIFYFAIGGIRVIASGPRKSPSVGEDLLERGVLDIDQFNRVNEAVNGDGRRFAEAAIQMGVCRPDEIQESLVAQVEDELLDLFFWDGAELQLVEGHPPKSFYEGRFQTAALSCNVAALLQGVLERVDVWRQTVSRLPNGREVYETTERAAADLNGRHGRLLTLLDGSRTTADAIEKSRLRRVPAFEFLMVALQQGKVRRTVGSVAQRVTREQLLRDIELLEQALRHRVEATVVRKRLARTLEQAGEMSRAASQWRELGDFERKRNDLDRALECYSECVRVLPTDFATRELILDIYRHRKEYAQVVAHGRPLADLFLKHNLLNRAKQLLLQLVGLEPNDVGLRRQLIIVLIGLGERDAALKQLRELARILEARHATPSELRDAYVRILALDPRDKNARKRLDEITGVATQRRVLRVTGGVTAALVVGIVTLFWLESVARGAVNEAIADARLMLLSKDLPGARQRLQRVVEDHPVSRSTRTAQGLLAQIERLQREQMDRANRRAQLAGRADEAPQEARQRRERAEATAADMAKEAQRLAGEGRVQDAHRLYKELLTMHAGTKAAETAKVPLAVRALPAGAKLVVNGATVGQGSALVEYAPYTPSTLEVELDGFERRRITIDGLQPPEMLVSLHRPVRWSATFDAAIEAAPLVHDGIVYVAGRDRFLSALSANDGKLLWRTPLGLYSDVAASPLLVDGLLVVATASGEAVALDPRTGEARWRQDVGAGVERPTASIHGTVVVAPVDGSITAISPEDGTIRWQAPPKTLVTGAPVPLLGSRLAWIDARGILQAADPVTGRTDQRPAITAVLRGTPAPGADDRIWAFAEDESLRLVGAESNAALRRFPVPRAFLDVQPCVEGDTAYVTSQDGSIAAFKANGETVFRRRLEQTTPHGVTVSSGHVYCGGAGGRLTVLDAATGDELWRFEAGARISSRPSIQDGTVFVATGRGELFALEQ